MTDNQLLTLAAATIYANSPSVADAARAAAMIGEIFGIHPSEKTQETLFGAALPAPWEDDGLGGSEEKRRANMAVNLR